MLCETKPIFLVFSLYYTQQEQEQEEEKDRQRDETQREELEDLSRFVEGIQECEICS